MKHDLREVMLWDQRRRDTSLGRPSIPFAHLNRVFSWSSLLVPPLSRAVNFPWWVPRSGMGSLLNFGFSLEPCHLRFFLKLRLLFLAVLESGAPLSSSLEEALYKCSV